MENIATIQTYYSLPALPKENSLPTHAIDFAGNNVPLDWNYITTTRNTRHGDGNITIEYPNQDDSVKNGLRPISPAKPREKCESVVASLSQSPSALFEPFPDVDKSDGRCSQPFRSVVSAPSRLESVVCAYCRQTIIR